MNTGTVIVMGIIAGGTIFIGLPVGRLAARGRGMRAMLNAITIGVLLFLLWDVLVHAVEPVEAALTAASVAHSASWWPFIGLAALLFLGVGVGLLGLVAYDRWIARRARAPRDPHATSGGVLRLAEPASRLAFLIAVGIGLHNFAEGLAIGQSAAGGELQLAVVLVIGFALHNATEGFGITAPLAGSGRPAPWAQLALLGVIGGGPTLVGTLLGSVVVNEALALVFLALAAGSIIYVLLQLVGVALRMDRGLTMYVGILIGLFAGFATDFVVTAAGV
ncbi:ZIP family metal transporter [Leifsonia sp. 2MCAF36]|uniref:ZIP family metal transporter n=1 Tax=Leifsonia sp. 2MCAF36 TaxID=3232988 RepID=UPI003F9E495A